MAGKTWIAILLIFGIWFGYMRWFAPIPVPTNKPAASVTTSAGSAEKQSVAPTGNLFVGKWNNDFQMENSKLEVGFSDVGGKIAVAETKKYRVTPKKSAGLMPVLSIENNGPALETGFTSPELQEFSLGKYARTVSGQTVTYSFQTTTARVDKTYTLKENSYFIESNLKITPLKTKGTDLGFLMIPVGAKPEEADTHNPLKNWEVVSYQNESLSRSPIGKIAEEKVTQGNTAWLAFGNKYFATAISNQGAEINPDIVLTKQSDFVGAYLRYPLVLKEGQKEINIPLRYYLGAKDYHELEGARMLGLIDYGTFAKLAYPLLWLLRTFYSGVHNYGVAIILLTILVRLLFYPLTLKSQQSMKAMQKLQPQIAALKEKYKE
ncbi:MAG: hypothetical protein EB078_12815, partial [Proteobacteria bacterium]|nr:hypothetical protein [Pseudomonadota bacterium]NDD05779.1 hypothetical protein [Pseudomonadota bacterium]